MPSSTKAKFEATIQPWGNSLGLRITRPMCQLAHLGRGDKVTVEVTDKGLSIRRKNDRKRLGFPFSESDLLEGLTPHTAHTEELPVLLNSEI